MSSSRKSRPGSVPVREMLKKALAIFGLTVIWLLALEVGCRVVLRAVTESAPAVTAERKDPRAELPAYDDAEYDVDLLLAEDHELRKPMYRPFVVWSRKPFAGELINIDDEGHRATHFSSQNPAALKLWLMGGSTMWGEGTPDAETIPSLVSSQLNERYGVDADVRNLGEIGYVSTQEIVSLMRELQLGRRPDYVVFLDGVNDAPVAALWPEAVGTHMNYYRIKDRFEAPGRRKHHPFRTAIQGSGVARFANYLSGRMGIGGDRYDGAWQAPGTQAEVQRRGEEAANLWLANSELIRILGQEYGFTPIFIMQPSLIVGAKPLAAPEEELKLTEMENEAKRAGMEVYEEMRRAVRARLAQPSPPAGGP